MKILKRTVNILGIASAGCSSASNPVVTNIAKNLKVVVHPLHEDRKGLKQVKKVCLCAVVKANEAWPKSRIVIFDELLQKHANEVANVYSDEEKAGDLNGNLLRIEGASGFPKPSPQLSEHLTEFAPFIAECEDSLGAYVEF